MAIIKTKGYQFEPARGYLGIKPTKDTYRYMKIGNRVEEVREVVVHEFTMGDVEDPELYAAQPLYEWEHSDQGQWIMKNAVETPSWYRIPDTMQYGYKFQIRAKLSGPTLTEWLLRYGPK
jgi:predicted phosphoadenosine phosphosulfate sulfurtransferase